MGGEQVVTEDQSESVMIFTFTTFELVKCIFN